MKQKYIESVFARENGSRSALFERMKYGVLILYTHEKARQRAETTARSICILMSSIALYLERVYLAR